MRRIHAWVHGRVQGVGYRALVQEKAVSLGIQGFVRNLRNGSVEVVGEGWEEALGEFLEAIRARGIPYIKVNGMEVEWGEARGDFTGFGIAY